MNMLGAARAFFEVLLLTAREYFKSHITRAENEKSKEAIRTATVERQFPDRYGERMNPRKVLSYRDFFGINSMLARFDERFRHNRCLRSKRPNDHEIVPTCSRCRSCLDVRHQAAVPTQVSSYRRQRNGAVRNPYGHRRGGRRRARFACITIVWHRKETAAGKSQSPTANGGALPRLNLAGVLRLRRTSLWCPSCACRRWAVGSVAVSGVGVGAAGIWRVPKRHTHAPTPTVRSTLARAGAFGLNARPLA